MKKINSVKIVLSMVAVMMVVGCNKKSDTKTNITETITTTSSTSVPTSGSHDNNETNTSSTTSTKNPKSLVLSIETTTLNKEDNTTLALLSTYEQNSTTSLNNVEWIVTPSDAVQITNGTLRAKKDTNVTVQAKVGNTLSNTLALNITWTVDGHVLPPEPDKALNDSTLLGIDTNDNGVRDDVERWIYDRYKDEHPIMIPLRMQTSRAYQKIIVDPSKAKETTKIMETAEYCEWAFTSLSANYFSRKPLVLIEPEDAIKEDKEMKYVQYNTTQRARAYGLYNQKLSGGVYELADENDKWIENCDFNTTKYIEMSEKL